MLSLYAWWEATGRGRASCFSPSHGEAWERLPFNIIDCAWCYSYFWHPRYGVYSLDLACFFHARRSSSDSGLLVGQVGSRPERSECVVDGSAKTTQMGCRSAEFSTPSSEGKLGLDIGNECCVRVRLGLVFSLIGRVFQLNVQKVPRAGPRSVTYQNQQNWLLSTVVLARPH